MRIDTLIGNPYKAYIKMKILEKFFEKLSLHRFKQSILLKEDGFFNLDRVTGP